MTLGPPKLTPRHLAVLGILRERPRATPEAIARELGFALDEVVQLLEDLRRSGHIPRTDR
jgi:DNA-binding MarR family transcriptional regulator